MAPLTRHELPSAAGSGLGAARCVAVAPVVNKAEFERLLATRPCGRSAHFALHHLAAPLKGPSKQSTHAQASKLSTSHAHDDPQVVDNLHDRADVVSLKYGCVVPKRHARRAVTRNLLKRQVRQAFARHAGVLEPGWWLVRLKSGFDRAMFTSAASSALAGTAFGELEALLAKATRA